MVTSPLPLLAALLLGLPLTTVAQSKQYTVWSSVVVARAGERTPGIWGADSLPTILTSLGANQIYSVGSFFRNRYALPATNESDGSAGSPAPIQGLSTDLINHQQIYVAALDAEHTAASAQAFLQAFYPPVASNRTVASIGDPSSVFANGTYLARPLQGYQYPLIHTINELNPEWPGMAGQGACPAYRKSTFDYATGPAFAQINESSRQVYQEIGPPLLQAVRSSKSWTYANAYEIYDYVSYQNVHNTSANALLATPSTINPAANVSYLDRIKWLADTKLFALNGNLTTKNTFIQTPYNAWADQNVTGSISTIGGNFLAGKILRQLLANVNSNGEVLKLSVLFGDFRPMISFFALASLHERNANFYGQPEFGSVMTFELYSMRDVNDSRPTFPSTDELWVRFYFRNGTDKSVGKVANHEFQSYPLFRLSPSLTDMPWSEFIALMHGISLSDVSDWCTSCGAKNAFCASFVPPSDADVAVRARQLGYTKGPISATVAGVLGMLCTLVAAALAVLAVMFFGRVRFVRVPTQTSELGGFKGNQKLASDLDLVLPKHGGVVKAEAVEIGLDGKPSPHPPMAHERHGSWELRQNPNPSMTQLEVPRGYESPRLSFEAGDGDAVYHRQSVQPRESV